MKYIFTDPKNEDNEIAVPSYIQVKIVKDYLQTTYYWSLGILCFIVGFLTGVAV